MKLLKMIKQRKTEGKSKLLNELIIIELRTYYYEQICHYCINTQLLKIKLKCLIKKKWLNKIVKWTEYKNEIIKWKQKSWILMNKNWVFLHISRDKAPNFTIKW